MQRLPNGPTWEAVFALGVSDDEPDLIVGIDEVGRGAWAGPVTAAAVILPYGLQLPGLDDSKRLTPKRRVTLDRLIRRSATAVGIGWVTPVEVDEFGLSWAVRTSSLRALAMLPAFGQVILDGRHNFLAASHGSVAYVGADATITPVAAASVVAKVARDRYLEVLERRFPGYGLAAHKGYGTPQHRLALSELGVCAVHRRSYRPLRELDRVND